MKRLSFAVLALALGSTVALGVRAGHDGDAAMLTQISNYRQWTRVNSEPVPSQVAVTPTVTGIMVNAKEAV